MSELDAFAAGADQAGGPPLASNKVPHGSLRAACRLREQAKQVLAVALETAACLQAEHDALNFRVGSAAPHRKSSNMGMVCIQTQKPQSVSESESSQKLRLAISRWEKAAGPLGPLLTAAGSVPGGEIALGRLLAAVDIALSTAIATNVPCDVYSKPINEGVSTEMTGPEIHQQAESTTAAALCNLIKKSSDTDDSSCVPGLWSPELDHGKPSEQNAPSCERLHESAHVTTASASLKHPQRSKTTALRAFRSVARNSAVVERQRSSHIEERCVGRHSSCLGPSTDSNLVLYHTSIAGRKAIQHDRCTSNRGRCPASHQQRLSDPPLREQFRGLRWAEDVARWRQEFIESTASQDQCP